MPLTRYQIRNEYSLADPELYRAADTDDPEALLEGVAMAGLVGVLRQLGDLAEFAAEIFHNLHEEVMATAARGHGLMFRVQQLEAECPSIEKAFLSQTSHSLFYHNSGVDWHPNLHMDQNLITQGDLPRFLMDSYEECRGPPRLFLLDKFDVAGAGACLKRYTDPSFFKPDSSYGMANSEVQRDKKTRKAKKKGSRWRNRETPEVQPTSHAKLHQLFLEESVENHINNPACRVKLKRRLNGFPFHSKTGKSYMEKFVEAPTVDLNVVREISVNSSPLRLPSNIPGESGTEILEISALSPGKELLERERSLCSPLDGEETERKTSIDELREEVDYGISEAAKPNPISDTDIIVSALHDDVDEKEIAVVGERKTDGSVDGYQSDDLVSEVDNYLDALTTMDSEMETDTEGRAKNDMHFLNSENQGMDSDVNEELRYLQAHFSDSQSAMDDGNSSSRKGMSSFSYSDSLSNLAETTPSDGDVSVKILPSTEICEAETGILSSDRHSVNEESPSIPAPQHKACDGVEESNMPSYRSEFGEPSSSSCPMLLPIEPGKKLIEGVAMGLELDETYSDHNELHTGYINPEENTACLDGYLPGTSNFSDGTSQIRADFLELSSENHCVKKLEDEDPHVLSPGSLHLSHISELAPGNEDIENLSGNVLQVEYADDGSPKISGDGQIDSPHSVASYRDEQHIDSVFPELESCDPEMKLNGIVSEVDDAPSLSGEIAISSISIEESPQAADFTKQRFPGISEDVPPFGSAEMGCLYSREKNHDEASNAADEEELCGFSADMNMVGNDAANLKFPSDFQNSEDTPSVPDVHLDNVVTETVHSEVVTLATAVTGTHCDDNGDIVKSLSTIPTQLQEESISSLPDHQGGMEINEACSPEHLQESVIKEEVDQQAVDSSDLDSVLCNKVSCDNSNSNLLNSISDLSVAEISGNSLHVTDFSTVPLSSDQHAQDSESNSSLQNNVSESADAALSASTRHGAELSTPLEHKAELQDDQYDVEVESWHDQDSESKSDLQINVIESAEDTVSSAILHTVELRTPLEQNSESQDDQFDVETQHADKTISETFSLVEQIQSPNHLDQERQTNASFEFCATHLPSQPPSVSEFLPRLDASEQPKDASSSIFPSFGLLPEASHFNLDDMPPLPPLPPMQWRIGKIQHASLTSERDSLGHKLESFPPNFPSSTDEKAQLGHLAMEGGGITQPSNPFLPLSSLKDENSQLNNENLAGALAHSNPSSLQGPIMVNHRNSEEDFLTSGSTKSTIPFLELPTVHSEKSEHGFLASEGVTAQPSGNPFSPAPHLEDTDSAYRSRSLPKDLVQPPETSSEDEKLQRTSAISEGKVMNSTDTNSPPLMVQDDQPWHTKSEHGFLASEGVTTQPSGNLFSPAPHLEDADSAYRSRSLPEDPVQPPETSFEDEKRQRTSAISEGKVMNSTDTNSPPLIVQDDQPWHTFPTFEGQTALSLSTSVPLPPFDDGNPNGTRLMKVPRPRNPLIDAVVAHDKSKLRKVTERVQPQTGQNVDERDSLLQQIRTKSFNLKPAVVTRPSIHGPQTNLKVAAILEKANAIRQAFAGSDEDDDEDSWSDS